MKSPITSANRQYRPRPTNPSKYLQDAHHPKKLCIFSVNKYPCISGTYTKTPAPIHSRSHHAHASRPPCPNYKKRSLWLPSGFIFRRSKKLVTHLMYLFVYVLVYIVVVYFIVSFHASLSHLGISQAVPKHHAVLLRSLDVDMFAASCSVPYGSGIVL